MSITVKLHVTHDKLALVPTLCALDSVHIRVITHGNTDPDASVFPFLIEHDDQSALESALDADPTVEAYECVDWTSEGGVYYIAHTPETKLISPVVTAVNGFMMKTETQGQGWLIRMLLPDREALNTIWEFANDNDISLEIIEIYGKSESVGERSYGLTDEQRQALAMAYEHGYFNEPRDVSLSEVAAKMDLSSTAMSGRLRRGVENLIAATINGTDEDN
ncbi:helix-turn-helix domain-containing protein [Halosegnis sp.]|uniref:helix-turn-helix domain-containing protein n=1 Tax=Halosegnis sp. TaxID=2864959 RepID=UPI0035D514D0